MATEPRKPKFTNHKTLSVLGGIVGFTTAASIIVAVFWWPPLVALGLTAGFVLMYLTYRVEKLNRWEVAQWVSTQSDIRLVAHTLEEYQLILQDLPESSPVRELRPALVLDNGSTARVTAGRLQAGPASATGVSYETRWVNGRPEYGNMKLVRKVI